MNAYASDKILAHLPVIQQLRDGEQPSPIYAQLVISDLCNQACGFCAYRSEGYESNQLFKVIDSNGVANNNPNRMIERGKAFGILNDLQMIGTKAILFTGGGEPTVHPQCKEIFRHARELGLDFAVTTNGTRFDAELIDILIQAKWVRISLDAGSGPTYAETRKSSRETFRRVVESIADLAWRKQEADSDVLIGVGFVVTRENWREVYDAAEIAKDQGADSFRISAAFTTERADYFDDWYDDAANQCREAESLSDDSFTVSNMFPARVADLAQGPPDYQTCHYMQIVTYIGADLNVYRCCDTAYNERGLIGSLKNQSFRELWESQAKRDDFASFNARNCAWCQFNPRNRSIETIVNPQLIHENFP